MEIYGNYFIYISKLFLFIYLFSALTLSLSQPCFHRNKKGEIIKLIGMVGVDLHMEDIVQEITYYSQGDGSYAFVITTKGIAFNITYKQFVFSI